MIKLGIAPIGWSNDDLPELGEHISFEQCIQEMSTAGFMGCEVGHKFPRDITLLTAALKPYQLQIASAWYSLYFTETGREAETINGFLQHLHFLKNMGAKVVVICECGHSIQCKNVSVFDQKPVFTELQWSSLVSGIKKIAREAHTLNMQLVYHYHMGTGVQTENEIDYLMSATTADELSLVLDTGHSTFSGDNPLGIIQKYVNRIKHVHLKDIRLSMLEAVKEKNLSFLEAVKTGVFTVPGDGMINFTPIIKALIANAYEGWFIVEAEQDPMLANPLTYATMAKQYLDEQFNTCANDFHSC